MLDQFNWPFSFPGAPPHINSSAVEGTRDLRERIRPCQLARAPSFSFVLFPCHLLRFVDVLKSSGSLVLIFQNRERSVQVNLSVLSPSLLCQYSCCHSMGCSFNISFLHFKAMHNLVPTYLSTSLDCHFPKESFLPTTEPRRFHGTVEAEPRLPPTGLLFHYLLVTSSLLVLLTQPTWMQLLSQLQMKSHLFCHHLFIAGSFKSISVYNWHPVLH